MQPWYINTTHMNLHIQYWAVFPADLLWVSHKPGTIKSTQQCLLPIKMNEESKCCKETVPVDSHPEVIICEDTRYILFRQKPRSALLCCIKARLNLCHCPPRSLTAAVNSTKTVSYARPSLHCFTVYPTALSQTEKLNVLSSMYGFFEVTKQS